MLLEIYKTFRGILQISFSFQSSNESFILSFVFHFLFPLSFFVFSISTTLHSPFLYSTEYTLSISDERTGHIARYRRSSYFISLLMAILDEVLLLSANSFLQKTKYFFHRINRIVIASFQ